MSGVSRARGHEGAVIVVTVAVLGIAFWLTGWRGVDHPAQAFRVTLFEQHGFTAWNTQWYAGHHTPGYGVLYPALASKLGEAVVAIAATAGSVLIFDALVRRLPRRIAATSAFAFMMLINLWEGRLPFAVGVALGFGAVLLATRGRWRLAALAVVLSSLGSPLAGAFVALLAAGWALGAINPRQPTSIVGHQASWLAVVAVAPVVGLAVLYPQGGFMPYLWQHFVLTVLGSIAVIALSLVGQRWAVDDGVRRIAVATAGLTIVAAMLFFFVETPVGGNLARLAVLVGPALIAVIGTRWGLALGLGLMLWHATPLLGVPAAIDDPARDAAYHQPLIDAVVERAGDAPTRLEIPFTERHWETAFVAPDVPLARGWERQLDHRFNAAILDEGLDESTYLAWLRETAVQFVAIPDVELEPESDRQAAIVRTTDELSLVWSNEHWELYEVADPVPLASAGIALLSVEPDRIAFEVAGPGSYTFRVRYSPTMRFESVGPVGPAGPDGAVEACVEEGADGWVQVVATGPIAGQIVAVAPWIGGRGCGG